MPPLTVVSGVWPLPSAFMTQISKRPVPSVWRTKTIRFPSGEYCGCVERSPPGPGTVSGTASEPSESMTNIWPGPPGVGPRSKTMRLPSGENIGSLSLAPIPVVSGVWPLPSSFITQICELLVPTGRKAYRIRSPSAEYDGLSSLPGSFVSCTRPDPSGFIVKMSY